MPQKNKKRFDSSLIKTTKKQYKKMPDSNIELEPWTKFVQSQGLMEYKDGEYIITNKGLAFMLTWHFQL